MQTRCARAARLKKGDIHLRGPRDAYGYRNGPGPGGKRHELDRSIASPFAISISRDNQFLPPPLGQIPFDEFSAVRRVRHEKFTCCTGQPTNTTFSTSPVQKRARHPVFAILQHRRPVTRSGFPFEKLVDGRKSCKSLFWQETNQPRSMYVRCATSYSDS